VELIKRRAAQILHFARPVDKTARPVPQLPQPRLERGMSHAH
jgi:hypothetical protein